jgi:hypothetical protein
MRSGSASPLLSWPGSTRPSSAASVSLDGRLKGSHDNEGRAKAPFFPTRTFAKATKSGLRPALLSGMRIVAIALAVCLASPCIAAPAPSVNDYPTETRSDYVFGCMKANGDTRTALQQCSCSIDVIASILPYDRYVEAEAVLSLAQVPGRFGAMFRSTEPANAAVNELRRAQAEAEVRCF